MRQRLVFGTVLEIVLLAEQFYEKPILTHQSNQDHTSF